MSLFYLFIKRGLMIAMKFSSASPLSSSASLLFLISCLMGSHVIMFNHCGSPLRSGWVTQPPLWLKCCLPALKWQDKELCGALGIHTHTRCMLCVPEHIDTHTHTQPEPRLMQVISLLSVWSVGHQALLQLLEKLWCIQMRRKRTY